MKRLRLVAMDAEDLSVMSAHCQDAVLKPGDIRYFPTESKLIVSMNRFVWELADRKRRPYERRRSALHFARVEKVAALGIERGDPGLVLSLLAITFEEGEAPSGTVEFVFAGGAALRFEVECIEAQLTDMPAAWVAGARPRHEV
ncbi:MAG: DUF2948 family protein [Pseudomonadota bacterium]|nr:DUF2948 family protein [Pseudomonadota bacterium]